MQYVLGNMLNGGGINPDGLSLDLQFAADKTLTARRGPTPVFSRASGATQINAQGLIEWVPENLVASSENMSAFTRTEVVAPVSVSGGPTESFSELAVTATNGFHFYRLFFNETTNTTSMMWVLAKRGTARYLRMGGGPASSFDWDTLTWSDTNPLHQTISPVAHPFGDGWYWLPIFRVSGSTLVDLTPSSTSGVVFSFNQSSVETVMVAAVQLSRSDLPQTGAINYYKTTGTSFYAPRFDHDSAGVCRGLLIEEGRTNLSLRSENIVNNIGWSLVDTTSVVSGTSPNGNSSYQISETNTSANHLLVNTGSNTGTGATSVVSGTSYTGSIFVKKVVGSIDWVQLTFSSAGFGAGQFANFNISNGTVGNYAGLTSGTVPRIEEFPNGWYRCSITATAIATTSSTSNIILSFINNTDVLTRFGPYLGSTSNSVLASLCQVEAGSFATSYIPTTTGSLARSADVCSITGGNFNNFYNQSEGTLFADVSGLMTDVLGGNRGFAIITDGTYANAFGILKSANIGFIKAEGTTGNMPQFTLNNAYVPFTQYKVALGVRTNDTNAAFNGSLKTTDTSVTLPSTMNRLEFRDATGAAGGQPSCHLAAIRYYRKRLPDAKLQALTV
jgi:hypothetical protein